jgi:uncharacterized membrane protein YozB (DUF420 family)
MKERIKERAKFAKDELRMTAFRLSMGDSTVLTRSDRIVMIAAAVLAVLFLAGLATQSHAAGPDIFDKAEKMARTYYGKLFAISSITAALCIIIGILWTMLSPTSNGARTPLAWIKKVILCYIVIMILGGIFSLIAELTSGLQFTGTP